MGQYVLVVKPGWIVQSDPFLCAYHLQKCIEVWLWSF